MVSAYSNFFFHQPNVSFCFLSQSVKIFTACLKGRLPLLQQKGLGVPDYHKLRKMKYRHLLASRRSDINQN